MPPMPLSRRRRDRKARQLARMLVFSRSTTPPGTVRPAYAARGSSSEVSANNLLNASDS